MGDGVVGESLMAYLGEGDREYLVGLGEPRVFGANEAVMLQGDPTDHVLILLTGWVRVSSVTPDGQEMLVAFRGPGDILGDLAALHGWRRTATVRTLEDVRALQFRSAAFVDMLSTRATVTLALVRQMSSRLREAEQARADAATLDVTKRVAVYLLRLLDRHGRAEEGGYTFDVPLTQQDVANRIGASLRAVARGFAILRDRGIVTGGRRHIVIARPQVLRAFVGNMPNGT